MGFPKVIELLGTQLTDNLFLEHAFMVKQQIQHPCPSEVRMVVTM